MTCVPGIGWLCLTPDFLSQALATLFGSIITAGIAFLVFRREQAARLADRESTANARILERQSDDRARLRMIRGQVVGRLMLAVRKSIAPSEVQDYRSPLVEVDQELEDALMAVLLDGTDDSLTVTHWVRLKMGMFAPGGFAQVPSVRLLYTAMRAMLIAWARDEPGVIVAMKHQLSAAQADELTLSSEHLP